MHSSLTHWADWLRAAERSESTIKVRRYHVERYLDSLDTGVDPLSLDAMSAFLATPRWSSSYRRSIRTSLGLWTTWMHRTGRIAEDPLIHLPKAPPPRALPRPCPEVVIRTALQQASTRVAAMIQLAAGAGLRRSEISVVHEDDLAPDLLGWSLLVHGKGRRERTVPLSSDVLAAIRRQLHDADTDTGWLFPPSGRWADTHLQPIAVGKLINSALPGAWTAHSLRHRFATQAYAGCHDLLLVQTLLGHSKPETTQIYVGLDTSQARPLVQSISIAA